MKKENIVFLLIGTLILVGLLVFGGFASLEPQLVNAANATSTATTTVTLTVTEEISLSASTSIALSPNITMTQQSSVGFGTWTVKTNNSIGYTLKFNTATGSALVSGSNYFTDVSTTTPTTWNTSAGVYQWGYSAYGTDVATSTWGNAGACGTAAVGGLSTTMNYAGFATSTGAAPTVATRSTTTPSAGIATTLCIAAEEGDNVYAPDGAYSAIITGTATTL